MNVLKYIHINYIVTIIAICTIVVSCRKDDDGTNMAAPGNLSINQIDPASGSGGDVLIVKGSGLGSIQRIIFEKDSVNAPFNPTFNNADAIVFRIPDTASGGTQNIIFINSDGKSAKATFKVIALPTVNQVSAIDVEAEMPVKLTGINLEDVSKVVLDGTTIEATILSTSKKELIIKMPPSTKNQTKLVITNSSGTRVTEQEFVYITNAYPIFLDTQPANVDYWGWSIAYSTSKDFVVNGTGALKAEYTGSWGGLQLHMKSAVNLTDYKYVTFWVKGAETDRVISFNLNWTNTQNLNVPAGKWTYFKFDLDLFKGAGVAQLNDFIMQINGDPATFHLDNILLIK